MFQQTELKTIHGRQVTVTKTGQRSILPSYFFGKKYAHIQTTLGYTEKNGDAIKIIIPSVSHEEENRKRRIRYTVNGQDVSLSSPKARTILDMTNTFDISDMPVLIDFAIQDKVGLAEDETQRFCLPFLMRPQAQNDILYIADTPPDSTLNWRHILKSDRGFIICKKNKNQTQLFEFSENKVEEKQGEEKQTILDRLWNSQIKYREGNTLFLSTHENVSPYANSIETQFIESFRSKIKDLDRVNQRQKAFIFPIAREGLPHHWEICVLNIDEKNQPSLTIVETSWHRNISAKWFQTNISDIYLHDILSLINPILTSQQYPPITSEQVFFHAYKQFSLRGCGIATSIHIQNILNGTLPNMGKPIKHFDEIKEQSYANISIEEDAMRRVQLARYFEAPAVVAYPDEFSQPLAPSLSEPAKALEARLVQYINDIKKSKLDNTNPFNQGFGWLSASQALNRKANYFLAKHLLFRIRRGDELADVFNMASIRKNREFILEKHRIQQDKCYANRGMNSQTLNQIIQDARSELELPNEDVNDHFYRTKFFKFWRSCFSVSNVNKRGFSPRNKQ